MAEEKETKDSIKLAPLKEEVESSYLDYAMSVIISRALPDVRDGLKPVHRRILYAMHEMGLTHKAKYKKSANVIGVVLGRYHPHGDQAVYDALCRMTQDFSLRYPLIDGQGNFGSNSGDAPAAYRYTQCRLAPISSEVLSDLEKNTVSFNPNYDSTTKEPNVLPAKLPNLLINGSMGIAVGMATNIPPHNLSEVCHALSYLLDHPKAEIDELLNYIKGPDFPEGGIIFNQKAIREAYLTGKGPLTMRAKTEILETKTGRSRVEIRELPWQVNKSDLLRKIADLVREKVVKGIKNIRDESARGETKIVLEIKKGVPAQHVVNRLFKLTSLQEKFYFNMVALGDGIQPKLYNLKEILEEYLKHREVVIYRRTEFDLKRTKDRLHILEGFLKAIENIDEIVKIIKTSASYKAAEKKLISRFHFSQKQAQAILEMKLRQLVNLEQANIKREFREKKKLKDKLEKILANPDEIKRIIKQELKEIEEKYGDARRTKVEKLPEKELKEEELISREPVLIIGTRDGYIKRLAPENFHYQKRGGKGIAGLSIKEEDKVEHLVFTNMASFLLCFTDAGKVYQMRTFNVPEAGRTSKGRALVNFLEIRPGEKVSAIFAIEPEKLEKRTLVMATTRGFVKKISLSAFRNIRSSGIIAIKLEKDDRLQWVRSISKDERIFLTSASGKTICFDEKDLRPMGRNSRGVRGMKISENDRIVSLGTADKAFFSKGYLLVVSENGYGKLTLLSKYRLQRRGGKGLVSAKITKKTGPLVSALIIPPDLPEFVQGDILIISDLGQVIRVKLSTIPKMNRSTQGVRLIRLNSNDKVASITLV